MIASIAGPDLLIVIVVVVLLFGGTQIPKLARSLGSASKEFKQAQDEGRAVPSSHSADVLVPPTLPAAGVTRSVESPSESDGSGPPAAIR
jgi:sec-independent protein translocase protein TatA